MLTRERRSDMVRRFLLTLAVAVAIAAPGGPVVAASPAAAGDPVALRQAEHLAHRWGRCPTSRPAHGALAVARHARGERRGPAARRALAAWRHVADECSRPVPDQTVDPTA